jgi:hypothetical protein
LYAGKKSLVFSAAGILALAALGFLGGCASGPQNRTEPLGKGPGWVYAPGDVYPEASYVSAVGYGLDRESAEKNALGALVAVFGQSVKGEVLTSYRYAEVMAGELQAAWENSEIDSAVKTSFAMETLVGAEIKDRWFDGKDTHYAVAVMDKNKSGLLYRGLIAANEEAIRRLTDISERDRYSLDAYVRWGLAGDLADANEVFLNVLSVLNPPAAALSREGFRPGDDFRLSAREVAQNIPIGLTLDQDPDGRLGTAFRSVITAAGFGTGGGSRYMLEVSVSLTDADLPQNPNIFIRYGIDAQFQDLTEGQTLFPFSINGREGHMTRSEAVNRALRVASERIKEEFGRTFAAYLAQISPRLDR